MTCRPKITFSMTYHKTPFVCKLETPMLKVKVENPQSNHIHLQLNNTRQLRTKILKHWHKSKAIDMYQASNTSDTMHTFTLLPTMKFSKIWGVSQFSFAHRWSILTLKVIVHATNKSKTHTQHWNNFHFRFNVLAPNKSK